MRVNITKDYYDGTRSKTAQVDLDGFSMSSLAFLLLESGVAGVTITPIVPLEKMIRHLTKSNEENK